MEKLQNYVSGRWVAGTGSPVVLVNPSTEEPVAEAGSEGVDFAAAVAHARTVGGANLRALSFARRGEVLKSLSQTIHAHRDELIELAMVNGGNTRSDAKFDIDGAAGTLGAYAELGQSLGDARFLIDGDAIALGRSSRMAGQHVMVPREGVAVHINAFNFPAWGLAEKAAVALLAGMPVVAKPATATALVAARMMTHFVASGVLPEGALSFIAGGAGSLLDALTGQDVLAFTGSSGTAAELRAKASVVQRSVHVNIEADSLNAAVLGTDVTRGSEAWQLFVSDVCRDITQKTGQKCTAIRRVIVPAAVLDDVRDDLLERLGQVKVGDPRTEGVTMGPVSTAAQQRDVRAGIGLLAAGGAVVATGGTGELTAKGVPAGKGYFIAPTLFVAASEASAAAAHAHEVFGPVATVIPYETPAEAIARVRLGGGGLVSTVYTDDRVFAAEVVLGLAAFHGRVAIGGAKVAGAWLGPGTVLPQMVHGGPGRAGGGEELGLLRGMGLYLQRTALQGYGPLIEHIVATAKRVM